MVSTSTRTLLHRTDDRQGMLALLEIQGFSATVRICNDTRDHDLLGYTWIGLGFEVRLPNDASRETGRAQLRIDNAGRDLTGELEALEPGATLMGVLRLVHRATPEVVDYEFYAPLSNLHLEMGTLVGTLGDDDVMRRPAVLIRHDPVTSPALFPD